MMPIMMSKEMPLPTPLSVMRSPNHMMSSVLHVKMVTAENHQKAPGFWTTPGTLTTVEARYPGACTKVMAMVKKRVHWLILFRPLSPSFWSFWTAGTAMLKSWMMIDAEM